MADFAQGTVNAPALMNIVGGVRKDSPGDMANENGNLEPIQFDSAGSAKVSQEGGKPTYYATSQFAADSTATDIAVFPGVAGVTAKILGILISSTATAAATGDVTIVRRKTANTAGTSADASVGQADTRDAAPSCQPVHYTAHPTALGTANGNVWVQRYVQPAAATGTPALPLIDLCKIFGGKPARPGHNRFHRGQCPRSARRFRQRMGHHLDLDRRTNVGLKSGQWSVNAKTKDTARYSLTTDH